MPAAAPAGSARPASWSLYNRYCAGCHGLSKQGSSAAMIQSAIRSNVGGMGSLSALTPTQIADLAAGK